MRFSKLSLILALACLAAAGTAVTLAQGAKSAATPVPAVLPPLPNPGFAPSRPMNLTRRAYEFAAKNPDVIKYVPCFCGCERSSGHKSNESCFVRARDARGNVQWDMHGWGCAICIDVAVEAAQMHALGADAKAIRTAIDRKWKGRTPTSTPTPHPPGH